MNKAHKLTWLYLLNFLLLQWFLIRLGKVIDNESGSIVTWCIIGPVLPLTGWWGNYIGRAKSLWTQRKK